MNSDSPSPQPLGPSPRRARSALPPTAPTSTMTTTTAMSSGNSARIAKTASAASGVSLAYSEGDAGAVAAATATALAGGTAPVVTAGKKKGYNPFKAIKRKFSSSSSASGKKGSDKDISMDSASTPLSPNGNANGNGSAVLVGGGNYVNGSAQSGNKNAQVVAGAAPIGGPGSVLARNVQVTQVSSASSSRAAQNLPLADDSVAAAEAADGTQQQQQHAGEDMANLVQLAEEIRVLQRREAEQKKKVFGLFDELEGNLEPLQDQILGTNSESTGAAATGWVRVGIMICASCFLLILVGIGIHPAQTQTWPSSLWFTVVLPIVAGICLLPVLFWRFEASWAESIRISEKTIRKMRHDLKECKTVASAPLLEIPSEDGENSDGTSHIPGALALLLASKLRTPEAEQISSAAHSSTPLRDRITKGMHMPHLPSVGARLRVGSVKRHGSARGAMAKSLNSSNVTFKKYERPEGEPPTDPWERYCYDYLPLEQTFDFSQDEAAFAAKLQEETKDDKDGGWDALPLSHKLMLLRGYADKKDRLTLTLTGIRYINDWRRRYDANNLTRKRVANDEEYFENWGSYLGGQDEFGHPLFYERVEEYNIDVLLDIEEFRFFQLRTQHLEVIQRVLKDITEKRGHRVCKYVYVLDLKGLSPGKHFTQRVRNMLQPIFKVSGDCYPDSLWSLWLINAPMTFRFIWAVIAPWIDPVVKAKIRLLGGSSVYLPAMQATGIPLSSIPKEMGGTCQEQKVYDLLKEFVAQSEQEERTAAANIVQEEDEHALQPAFASSSGTIIMDDTDEENDYQ